VWLLRAVGQGSVEAEPVADDYAAGRDGRSEVVDEPSEELIEPIGVDRRRLGDGHDALLMLRVSRLPRTSRMKDLAGNRKIR
jgi:hypothetical protein